MVLVNVGAMLARGDDLRAWWLEAGTPRRAVCVLAEQGEMRPAVAIGALTPRDVGLLALRAKGSWLERVDGRLRAVAVLQFVDAELLADGTRASPCRS